SRSTPSSSGTQEVSPSWTGRIVRKACPAGVSRPSSPGSPASGTSRRWSKVTRWALSSHPSSRPASATTAESRSGVERCDSSRSVVRQASAAGLGSSWFTPAAYAAPVLGAGAAEASAEGVGQVSGRLAEDVLGEEGEVDLVPDLGVLGREDPVVLVGEVEEAV